MIGFLGVGSVLGDACAELHVLVLRVRPEARVLLVVCVCMCCVWPMWPGRTMGRTVAGR